MGRRLCENNPNHPNNVGIPVIAPDGDKCRVCGGALSAREDDQDEDAINKRHDIYYDESTGTMAACNYFKNLMGADFKYIELDGEKSINEIKEYLISQLA
jgi:adenylate kinase